MALLLHNPNCAQQWICMCVFQRCEFERQKASRLKSDFFSLSPVKKTSQWNRRESTALGDLRTHTHTHTHTHRDHVCRTNITLIHLCVCVQVHRSSSLCLHVPHHHLRGQRSRWGPVWTWSWPPTPLSCTRLLHCPTAGLMSDTVSHTPLVSVHSWTQCYFVSQVRSDPSVTWWTRHRLALLVYTLQFHELIMFLWRISVFDPIK